MKHKQAKALIPLFLVVLIDSMGFGFLFPILTPMFLHGHPSVLPADVSIGTIHFVYGLVVAMYPLFMFIGAPFLGDLSDKLGRKRVLTICLLGTGFGYLVCGWGITAGSLILLLLGRIISGLTAATLPMAQAAVADVSHDSASTAKYMGWMMFSIAGGQVFGPLLAGILSDNKISELFTNSFAFYVATFLTLLNIIWLLLAFKETYVVEKGKIDLLKTIRSYKSIVSDRRLFLMTLIFFCMQIDWSFFSQGSPGYLEKEFGYNHFLLGLFSASLGILIAIGGGFITPKLAPKMDPKKAATLSMCMLGLGTLISIALTSQLIFWLATILTTIGAAIAFSFIITLFSEVVDKSKQGWVMGITGAVIAIAWAITAMFSGIFLNISSRFPDIIGGIVGLIGAFLLFFFPNRNASEKKE